MGVKLKSVTLVEENISKVLRTGCCEYLDLRDGT
jgi:hypothetical protein